MKMITKALLAATVAISGLTAVSAADAAVLVLGAGWKSDTVNNTIQASNNSALTFTIASGQQAYFRLTDAFVTGDVYTIRDSATNALIGTSTFTTDGAAVPEYSGTAWSDTSFSRFSILLGAGSYSFNIFGNCAAGCPAGLAERLDAATSAVPEAATWAMMIAGFGMMGAALRTRRRSTTVAFA